MAVTEVLSVVDPSAIAPSAAAPPEAEPPRRGVIAKLVGKAGWNLIDQVLSSGTNAVLSILVARSVDSGSFGAFSTAFLLFSLLIAIERALAGQVLSIRHSAAEGEEWPEIASRALGTVATLAVPAGAVLAIAGLIFGGQLEWPLIAVGVTMPPLLMQDNVRSIFFAQSRADLAALNDGVWAVIQFTVMGILIVGGWANTGSLIFAWGASAAFCVLLGTVQLHAVPRFGATPGWVHEHRDLLAYLLPETMITSGGDKVAYLLIGKIVNLGAVGAVNAARQILNPLLIISQATMSFAMPEVSRRMHLSVRVRWYLALALAAVQALSSLAYTGIVLLLPDSIGHSLFRDSWQGARSVLLPMGLFSTTAGICLGPFVVIAAMGHAKRTFRVTMLQTVLAVVLMPLGAVIGGTAGAAWGLFIGKVIEVPFWFGTLRTAARLGPVLPEDDDEAAEPDGGGPGRSEPDGVGRLLPYEDPNADPFPSTMRGTMA
jgi:O-antigen/teichoic acid export membrane protein